MKRILLNLLVCALYGVSAYSEVKFETQGWFDYKQTMTSNYSGYPVQYGGQFTIGRFYLTLQGDMGKDWFGNGIKGRFTIDLANAQATNTSQSQTISITNIVTPTVTNQAVTNISTIKPAFTTYSIIPVKFAYIDYAFLTAAGLKNEAVLSAGLIKSYFGNIADWAYPIPVKDAVEIDSSVAPSSSADFGLMLSGKLFISDDVPDGYFKYYLEVLNGEGYKFLFNNDGDQQVNAFAYQAAAYIMPLKGVSLGGTFRVDPRISLINGSFTNTITNTRTSYSLLAGAKNLSFGDLKIPADFLFQYISLNQNISVPGQTTNNSVNGAVVSVMLGYGFLDNTITPYVRYDTVNQNDGAAWTNSLSANAYRYSMLYLGVNFMPTANLQIKPFYTLKMAQGAKDDGYTYLYLELDYKLNFTL